MAASQKKTTNTRGQKKSPSRKKSAPAPTPSLTQRWAYEIASAICMLLSLCVVVSYFNADAFFLAFLATVLRGLFGSGYWICGVMLAAVGVTLLRHRSRPVLLRSVCMLLLPLLVGAMLHLFFSRSTYTLGLTLPATLWIDGQTQICGGVLGGLLTVLLEVGFGKIITAVLLLLLLLVVLIGVFHITPEMAAEKVRVHKERRAAAIAEAEEEARLWQEAHPVVEERKPVRSARRRAAIDIPVDDEFDAPAQLPEAVQEPQPETAPWEAPRKSFFKRKSEDVIAPDELLTGAANPSASQPEEPAQPEEPKTRRARKASAADEVQAATEEVSRAIEEGLAEGEESYHYPPITLLDENRENNYTEVGAELRNNSRRLAETLRSFGVDAKAGEVVHGPSVTRYEFILDQGVKLSKITNLADDIALALGASGVRIAPIPNKISVVGIEVPNRAVTAVRIRDVIESRSFTEHRSNVAFAVGKDIGGNNIVGDIGKLPHVLIAGTTGSGKSVCTNSLIVSMLYKSTPEEVRFIMVDPKMVELAPYNGIPHLLIPVVTDPKKAAGALQWAVYEMMKRYKLFSEQGVKDLAGYNALQANEPEGKKMPSVVVVIDELADLMLVAAKEVEESICRVAQMGRAAGMHLVIATQRPSSDVITGLMKANIPSRIAFAVASSLESRIILDTQGAEKLVGKGDMLYFPLGAGKPLRVQGCFITPEEIDRVVTFVKESGEPEYSTEVMEKIEETMRKDEKGGKQSADPVGGDDCDELFPSAVEVVLETGQASVSMLQRRLKLGYSRAARLVDQMEERGIVGPFEGSKPRQLLIDRAKWQELQMANAQPEPAFDRSGSIRDVFESHDALD